MHIHFKKTHMETHAIVQRESYWCERNLKAAFFGVGFRYYLTKDIFFSLLLSLHECNIISNVCCQFVTVSVSSLCALSLDIAFAVSVFLPFLFLSFCLILCTRSV